MKLGKDKRKGQMFDAIAPIYDLFYGYQKMHYREVLNGLKNELDLSAYKRVIDIGCGTGALCSVLKEKGLAVTGVDTAGKMLSAAKKKQENEAIDFVQKSVLERLPFEDKSFDISIASFVAHGLKGNERKVMYSEMSRITKQLVIIYDYNKKRTIISDIIEWLEHGDYFNFIKIAEEEMRESFQETRVIGVGPQAAWYICIPKNK